MSIRRQIVLRAILPNWWHLKHRLRAWLLAEHTRIRWGSGTRIEGEAVLSAGARGSISIGDRCRIHSRAMLAAYDGHIRLGHRVTVNPFCMLYGHGGLDIGDDVLIANHTTIIPANHVFEDRAVPIRDQGLTKRGIKIERNVWIGSHVTILDGVTVREGAVIAAGAVVAKDVAAYCIVGGIPAKVIRHRVQSDSRASAA
jgi:acetyltransferase-like isoleucine patch superfamily enzyme